MKYDNDPFELEGIPDFALQPARGADEYNNEFLPEKNLEDFDAAVYDRMFHKPPEQRPIDAGLEKEGKPAPQEGEALETIAEGGLAKDLDCVADLGPEAATEFVPVDEPQLIPVAEPQLILATEPQLIPASEPQLIPAVEPQLIPDEEPELIPVAAPEPQEEITFTMEEEVIDMDIAQKSPVPQPIPIPKAVPAKIIPVIGSLLSSRLKLVDVKKKPEVRVYLEEDILVPDVKPDLASILSMDGKIRLSEREIHTSQSDVDHVKISGELDIKTLYIPENMVDGEPLVSIESRLPFKNEMEIRTEAYSDLLVTPTLESIDFTVINERKFKAKATILLNLREYSGVDLEVFEGIRDEEVQMLKEKIRVTDVALRKTESLEIKEELSIKDTMPEIAKILKYDVNISENHKQITKEKAVINSSIYCNVMYIGKEAAGDVDKANVEDNLPTPVLYQGKTEFTQFISLDGDNSPGGQNPAGSRVNYNITSLSLTPKEDADGRFSILELDMGIGTGLELYKDVEKEVVTDVYHHLKDVQFDTEDIGLMSLSGSGVSETSVREIINIPQKYGNVDKIAYISGAITEKPGSIEQGKNIVEGTVAINLICVAADEKKTLFSIKQDIPFRSAMEIPGISQEMTADNDIFLKELWFDKINNRQIEVNAGIQVNSTVSKQESHQLVKNVSFLEDSEDRSQSPGIVLYIARARDNIWKIAKKYRTTIDEIKKINGLESSNDIKAGSKLLIVAKNH